MSDPNKERKPDLSKYIDDNIRNFDLLASRKRVSLEHKDNSTSGSTSTSSTRSSKFSIDVVELPTQADTNCKVDPAKLISARATRSKIEMAQPDNIKVSSRFVANEQSDAVPGIRSKPKRVSFIASEPDVEVGPAASNTATASVTKDVRIEAKPAQPSVQAQPEHPLKSAATGAAANQAQQPAAAQPQPAWGILGDPARYVEMNGRHYIRLNVLGKGGSSCVYRIIGADDGQVYAYKRVEVKDSEDTDAVFDSYANEIALLRRLSSANVDANADGTIAQSHTQPQQSHPASSRIIELIDCEVRRDRNYIAMVLEAGDIDLAKVLTQKNAARNTIVGAGGSGSSAGAAGGLASNVTGSNGVTAGVAAALQGQNLGQGQSLLDPFFARMVWREMLEAVDHIHAHRIVHGDLKPANFVFVKGHLKLIDFGIAKSFNNDTTNIYRESQIGTINYMAPEAIAPMSAEDSDSAEAHGHQQQQHKMRLGRASDIWSLGCILYQMIYGRPPFAALNTIQKLSTIPNPKHVIKYPEWGDADAISSMRCCLVHDPRQRSKIQGPNGLLEKAYLKVATASTALATAESPAAASTTAVGKEQVQNIVGAVLDALSDAAQQALTKAQAVKPATTGVSTRNSRGSARLSAEAQEAQKLAQGVVSWIDSVDQAAIEAEVMEVVVEQEGWQVVVTAPTAPIAATAAASAADTAMTVMPVVQEQEQPPVVAPVCPTVPATVAPLSGVKATKAIAHCPLIPAPAPALAPPATTSSSSASVKDTPQSAKRARRVADSPAPHISNNSNNSVPASPAPLKRKVADTPGSVTRSGAKRASLRVDSASIAIYADTPAVLVPAAVAPVVSIPAVPIGAVVPAELSLLSAAPLAVPSTTTSSSNSSSVMSRASTWAPVSISRPPLANLAGASNAAAQAQSSAAGSTFKPFNPKPAFLSNILGSSSKLTSFIGASSSSASTTAAAAPAPATSSSSSSSSGSSSASGASGAKFSRPTAARSPLKTMPLTLQQQIQRRAEQRLNSSSGSGGSGAAGATTDRAAKWVKPAPVEEPSNLHSSLERQLGALRKLMNWDEEATEVTETVDGNTSFNFF